ncbi:non-ribosomal peptide synthetase [Paenibacillus sp. 598K]|uniref:non-ribosomal peptide synthetase n=1 Tax=Paenibacillus sp. 598K TaxID=1117987 RepID=UPI001623CCCD|nr:non-ribosomal peptide synthetase [Paenibacillus sp. 598K]
MCETVDLTAAMPLTHPQKRIMYVEQRYPDCPVHVVGCLSLIRGMADAERLERAIRRFVATHDAFRLRFVEREGDMLQALLPAVAPFDIPVIDLSQAEDPDQALEDYAAQEARKPMPCMGDTLFRFAIFRLDRQRSGYLYTMHHLITDGWSVHRMSRDIARHYQDDAPAGTLPAESPGYLPLLERERRYAASPRAVRDREFWMERFATLSQPLFPEADGDLQGRCRTVALGAETSAAIRQYAEERGLSIASFFTGLSLIWLYRSQQTDDLAIGVPVYNRTTRQEKEAFGVYTSLMPLRVRIDGEDMATSFLMRTQEELRSCYAHQRYPYDLLAQELELGKQGRQGLFQATVNVYNTRLSGELGGWQADNRELYSGYQLHPLELVVHDWSEGGALAVEIKYQAAVLADEQIEAMAEMLRQLLQGVLCDDSQQVDRLPVVSPDQQRRLLDAWGAGGHAVPDCRTVHSLLEEQALYRPEHPAVVCGGRQLTYRQLNEQANRLAHLLRRRGVRPDSVVAVMMQRSVELLVGIYGVLKAGGAYVPIDPTHPPERIRHVLTDSGAAILLLTTGTRADAQAAAGGLEDRLELIDLEEAQTQMLPSVDPAAASGPNDLAYVMYTSGSTGRPKGVMIEHRSVVNFIEAMAEELPWPGQPVMLGVTTVSFDIFVTETLLPLAKGMPVVLADEREQTEAARLRTLIRQSGVNVLQLTPSRMMLLLEGSEEVDWLAQIELILLGGEPLPPLLLEQLKQRSGARIFNMYGPTETTVWSALQEMTDTDTITVGRPIRHTQALILDSRGELLPVGMEGELCIAGEGLARGYRNRPELTEQQFVFHPLSANGRLYRTGDLARWRADGTIEHLGRIDRQVKIRGYRIEPGEIEHCLMAHDAIRMAAVVDAADAFGVQTLYAFCTASRPLASGELRSHAAAWLPSYMIPAVFRELPELPLTTSGKVDRKALAAMTQRGRDLGAGETGEKLGVMTQTRPIHGAHKTGQPDKSKSAIDSAARQASSEETSLTGLAATIAACLSRLLPGEPLQAGDDFFRHGGHSLHVLRAVALMKERGIPARASDLYTEPTPLGLAALLRQQHGSFGFAAAAAAPELTPSDSRSAIRVLSAVTANKDAFTWEEINCFTKPMAILFEALSPSSYELFLFHVQFALTFFPDGWRQDLFERSAEPHSDFFEMYGKLLQGLFDIAIERRSFVSVSEMSACLTQAIDNGHPVLIPGDLYGLFYSHHYMSEPHTHYFIVKGYDAKRGLVYLLDNMHTEEGTRPLYTDFVIRLGDLYEMSRYYADNWCGAGTKPHLWELSKQDENVVTPLQALDYHQEQLERWARGESALRFIEQEMAREAEASGDAARIMKLIPLPNYKRVYYSVLFRLLGQAGIDSESIEGLRSRSLELAQAWEAARLQLFDRIGEPSPAYASLHAEMAAIVAREHVFFGEMLAALRRIDRSTVVRSSGEYDIRGAGRMLVYNPNGTQMELGEQSVRITHTEERPDDTWIVKDEAPQLLLRPVGERFSFEVRVHSRNTYGPCFHNGIIVKFGDTAKVMFGCARRKLLGVFYPEHTDNYEWYARSEVNDLHDLRVEADGSGRLHFLARHGEEEQWERLCELPIPAEVRQIGIFSKTWEPTNHTSEFSQFQYKEDERLDRKVQAAIYTEGRG